MLDKVPVVASYRSIRKDLKLVLYESNWTVVKKEMDSCQSTNCFVESELLIWGREDERLSTSSNKGFITLKEGISFQRARIFLAKEVCICSASLKYVSIVMLIVWKLL
jgi:fructose/tagatose bisphosphate aldolase